MQSKKAILSFILVMTVSILSAQSEDLKLACPLEHGTIRILRASDKEYQKASEYGVMFTSRTDTVVKAVHEGAIAIVARTEGVKFDVVILYRNSYFWYAGVVAPAVKMGDKIQAGDIIGSYKSGEMLELMMFEKEEPVNPRKYLQCN